MQCDRLKRLLFPQVDTIAADKRFTRGSAETNLETRDIGPITKKGIYVALQVEHFLLVETAQFFLLGESIGYDGMPHYSIPAGLENM